MFKKLAKCKFHLRPVFKPLIRYWADNLGDYIGITQNKREVPVIVSLTSFPQRFDDLAISLYSLLTQTLQPDRIILWLSDEIKSINDLPYDITRFIKNGLEIRFVKDIRSYTKIIYTLEEFSNNVIVTADDDIFYPKDWLEKLYYSYASHPEDIQVHRAHRLILNNTSICPYESWQKHVKEETARFDNFLTGVGGVLYPPNCFKKEVLRKDIFLEHSPYADDVWLWFMALISNRKIRVVKNHIKTLSCINFGEQILKTKHCLYSINAKGLNDEQIQNLMKLYRQNILAKLK